MQVTIFSRVKWGDDVVIGDEGANSLLSGPGNDVVEGGVDRDYIVDYLGDDDYAGGDGIDTIDFFRSTAAVVVELTAGTAQGQGADTMSTVENVNGSKFPDEIRGDNASNVLFGNLGLDQLYGLAGDDLLRGGRGDDPMDGGDGIDMASFDDANKPVSADLAAGFAEGFGSDNLIAIESIAPSP